MSSGRPGGEFSGDLFKSLKARERLCRSGEKTNHDGAPPKELAVHQVAHRLHVRCIEQHFFQKHGLVGFLLRYAGNRGVEKAIKSQFIEELLKPLAQLAGGFHFGGSINEGSENLGQVFSHMRESLTLAVYCVQNSVPAVPAVETEGFAEFHGESGSQEPSGCVIDI